MKKIITALVLVGMLFLLVGCGKDKSSSDDKDYDKDIVQSEESEKITFGEIHNETEETTQEDVVVPEPVETVYLYEFIGKTVAEITDMFGTDYTVSDYNGGYFIGYQDQPFAFFYRDPVETSLRSDVPELTDEIFIVMSGGEGTAIFDGVEIGSTVSDIESCLNINLAIYYDEMECEHYTRFDKDGCSYIVYVDENNVITSCQIWVIDAQ